MNVLSNSMDMTMKTIKKIKRHKKYNLSDKKTLKKTFLMVLNVDNM